MRNNLNFKIENIKNIEQIKCRIDKIQNRWNKNIWDVEQIQYKIDEMLNKWNIK